MSNADDSIQITVDVTVNGQDFSFPVFSTLADLVERLGDVADGTASALNGEFIPRGQRSAYVLCFGDKVDLFQPIVGG